jgi:hypothetical protein
MIKRIKEQLQSVIKQTYGLDIPVKIWYDKKRKVYVTNVAFDVSTELNKRLP